MKIAIVVQRYGADINGGAEQHARYIAQRLTRHVEVEVLTTCASDYITWRNDLPPGESKVNGITVRRFPVSREREPVDFAQVSDRVFRKTHAIRDELVWLEAEGPTSLELIEYIRQHERAFDYFIFFSFRYYHAYHGARAVSRKAVLVPTAERDAALGMAIFRPIFRGVRALMYNSFEERAAIQASADNAHVPGVVVGVGSDIPAQCEAARFRQKFKISHRFAVYIGRIDENKGCSQLFDYFQYYARILHDLHLVLIGNPIISIPEHTRIHHVGYLNDQDKFDALAAAELLIMPSYLESLSMVALEAWALGKPVLANGRCDVLRGQCIRSNGGLYYDNFQEFIETLRAIDVNPSLAAALGRNGRDYFERNYAWPIIERKYLDMLARLSREPQATPLEAMPGWFARRRNDLPPANDVVARLPTGPALERDSGFGIRDSGAPGRDQGSGTVPGAVPAAPAPTGPSVSSERRDQNAPPREPALAAGDDRRRQHERPKQGRTGNRRPFGRGPGGVQRRPGARPPRRPGGR